MREKIFSIIILSTVFVNTYGQQWVNNSNVDSVWISSGGTASIDLLSDIDDTLYMGGTFNRIKNDTINCISYLANNRWNKLGNGLNGSVYGISRYNGVIIAGGDFTQAYGIANTKYIAFWNGLVWNELINSYGGINSISGIGDICLFQDTVFIASDFPSIPTRICGYDFDIQDFINIGSVPSVVQSFGIFNDDLYCGGTWFSLKKYVGGTGYQAWQDVGGQLDYYIQDMAVDTFNNFLYVGGGFTTIDDTILTDNVAIWNGFNWEKVGYGNGKSSDVLSVEVYQGDLYAGLAWDSIGGVFTNALARWDGTNWNNVGDVGFPCGVYALEEFHDTLYVGGNFTTVNGQPQKALARWYAPQFGCNYLKPRVLAVNDTFKINNLQPTVEVQFYNNNAYADGWDWDFDDGQGVPPVYTQNASHVFDTPGSYQVSVTVSHQGCTKTASKVITIINNTGTEEYTRENLQFKLYPNPTSGEVTVECTLPANKSGELRTHQVNGSWKKRYALNGGFNQIVIPENEVSSGISMVSLFVDGEFVLSEKVVRR